MKIATYVDRTSYLGASDAPAALGLSKWKTPVQLWLEKTGQVPPGESSIPMRLGNFIEPLVLELFEEKMGKNVGCRQSEFSDPHDPWRKAHIDGLTFDNEIVEAKTAGMIFLANNSGWGEEGTDEIPDPYIVQIMHQFSLLPTAKIAWLPVLIRGDFRVYRVERNDDLIHEIVHREQNFWRQVVELERPAPVTVEDLHLLFPDSTEEVVQATEEIFTDVRQLMHTKKSIKILEAMETDLTMKVKSFMGEAGYLHHQGEKIASWKTQNNNRLNMENFKSEQPEMYKLYLKSGTSRVLRLSKGE